MTLGADDIAPSPDAVRAFAQWARSNRILVIKGWRSALMQYSDSHLVDTEEAAGWTHASNPQSLDEAQVREYWDFTLSHKLGSETWPELLHFVQDCEAREAPYEAVLDELLAPVGLFEKYEYEDVVTQNDPGRDQMRAIFSRLLHNREGGPPDSRTLNETLNLAFSQTSEVTLHPPTCDSRVKGWATFEQQLKGTRTLRACDKMARDCSLHPPKCKLP